MLLKNEQSGKNCYDIGSIQEARPWSADQFAFGQLNWSADQFAFGLRLANWSADQFAFGLRLVNWSADQFAFVHSSYK